jgi:hypothetical protein
MSIEIVTTVASAVLTALAAALSSFATKRAKLISAINERQPERRDYKSEVRLPEIDALLAEESSRKTLYRYSAAFLVCGQFVVGGLLASSFVADNLSKSLVGILGLLVLASSLVNQHFRPDILHKAAASRMTKLRILKRHIEDELFDIMHGPVDDGRIVALRKQASIALAQIEATELSLSDGSESKEA